MTEKKSILLLASAAALTLALHENALSSPLSAEPAPTATLEAASPEPETRPTAAQSATPEPAPKTQGTAGAGEPAPPNPKAGAAAPSGQATATPLSSPLQPPMRGAKGAQSSQLTPEERRAAREQRFQKMRERLARRHQEMMDRWDSYWKILDAMTPEQKEAIEAVFGQGKRWCSHKRMNHQVPPEMRMQPHFGGPQYDFPSVYSFPGWGYGYGPQRTEPFPHERGRGASWLGEQPMYPDRRVQPWYDSDQGSFQGPPPPSMDYRQP